MLGKANTGISIFNSAQLSITQYDCSSDTEPINNCKAVFSLITATPVMHAELILTNPR